MGGFFKMSQLQVRCDTDVVMREFGFPWGDVAYPDHPIHFHMGAGLEETPGPFKFQSGPLEKELEVRHFHPCP